MILKCIIFILLTAITCNIESAKILGIFNLAAYSHYQLGDTILKELANRGHQVTVISPYEETSPVPNFKTVVLTNTASEMEKEREDLFKFVGIPGLFLLLHISRLSKVTTESVLNHPNVQKLLKSDEKFDLVIIGLYLNEAFQGFCYQYNAPCVTLSTVATSMWTNAQVGNPGSPSYLPEIFAGLTSGMNFFERVYNTFVHILQLMLFHLYTMPIQNDLLQKYFPGAPHISKLYYNTSLILLNSNAALNSPVALVPNMIEIGGYHVKRAKKLPQDLQAYLDSAKNGAVYFSMGSNIKSRAMHPDKRDAILRAFSKFNNVKFLWKWEDDNLPNKPDNVKISKWLPQQDILAHPNVKIFISHGGFLSTIEAVYHGIPIIGVPIYSDQTLNIANAENTGYGIKLEYNDLSEDSLTLAISKILNNSSYTENVKKRSKMLHDQPEKPLDKAMFWLEYVIRHKGAPHLRTAALSLKWYQYLLLDVLALVVFVTITVVYIFYVLVKTVYSFKKRKRNVMLSKKKN